MPHEVKRWKCDHCNKAYTSKGNANKHEKRCIYNPEQKACPSCYYDYRPEMCCSEGARGHDEAMIRNCSLWKDREDEEDG